MTKFGAIGLRPCQSAVNTTLKPSTGLAAFRGKTRARDFTHALVKSGGSDP